MGPGVARTDMPDERAPGAGGESDEDGRDTTKILLVVAAVILVPIVLLVVGVILAAVVGTFVVGLGTQPGNAVPQASFEFQSSADGLQVTHVSGESLSASAVEVTVDGERVGTWDELGDPGTVEPGDSILVPGVDSGDTVRLVWDAGPSETGEIARYTVP